MSKLKKLGHSFYRRNDVVKIAKELVGKILITRFDGLVTAGRIVETEAYAGALDRASHAYAGKRTKRTEVMFGEGGRAYVYLCYGIHHLFNVVTNKKDIPHAILIRALEPMTGIDIMLARTGKKRLDFSLTRGPGNVSKALGLVTRHSGKDLVENELFIADDGFKLKNRELLATRRIGVDYAGKDALLLYRFSMKGNKYVSKSSGTPVDAP